MDPEPGENPYLDREEYLAALDLLGFRDLLPGPRWPCPPESEPPPQ